MTLASVDELFRAAHGEHQAGRLPQAEALYREVLTLMPNHADALHLLGVLAHQLKNNDAAAALIGKAIQVQPNAAGFYSNYNVVLTALGRYPEALAAIVTALKHDPQNAEYLNNLGITQMRQQQWDLARQSFQAALRVKPDYELARSNLVQLEALAAKPGESKLRAANFPGSDAPTVTNPYRNDGFGSQFQTLIYSVIYAELTDKKFVYTPFSEMAHNYDNDPDYLAKKETLINFISNFDRGANLKQSIVREDFIRFFEQNLELCATSNALRRIKQIFRMNKNVAERERLQVAIHVRRPNPHDNRVAGTDTPDSLYVNTINALRNVIYKDKPVHIHIHSQGSEANFEVYKSIENMSLHLNESVEESFTAMVYADVLVTSRSSLSYVAALLSEGDVYYLPFWHPPLKHWKVLV